MSDTADIYEVAAKECHGFVIRVVRDEGVYRLVVDGVNVMSPTMAVVLADVLREMAAHARRWQVEDDAHSHVLMESRP